MAEATTSITRIFSGAISDWLGKRKLLVLIGYGLAAFTKPLFPVATGIEAVFVARFVDRIGKGIRGAPRDALIADVTPPTLRGTAFGLRQSMDTVGAFVGPLLTESGGQCGSFYIFEAEDEQHVRDWLSNEPFCTAGIYERVVIRRFFVGYNRLPMQEWPTL